MSGSPFVVFETDGERLALPARAVEQVLLRPSLLRLPSTGAAGGQALRQAAHIGDEIVPLLNGRARDMVLVLLSDAGRIAFGVDHVLGVGSLGGGPLGAGDSWAGRPVRRIEAAECERALGVRRRPEPFLGRGATATAEAAPIAVASSRSLQIRSGGADWLLAASEVVAVHDAVSLVPVPLAPPELLGAALLYGQSIRVVVARRSGIPHAAIVVVRGAAGLLAIALDAVPAWVTSSVAPLLHADGLRAAAGLLPGLKQSDLMPALPPPRCGLLPVMVGDRRFGLPMDRVQRVMAPSAVARLPRAGAGALHGAMAVDGRVVPMTDARRWLGLDGGDAAMAHVLVRPDHELHVLAVDAVGRPLALDAADLQPLRDPAGRLAGLAHLPDGLLPVLDVRRIGAAA